MQMLQHEQVRALNESVARLVSHLFEFSLGKSKLKDLISVREETLEQLRAVPGIFLVTPNGQLLWERLANTHADQETAESIAENLARVLEGGGICQGAGQPGPPACERA
jgi:hypothetical protein